MEECCQEVWEEDGEGISSITRDADEPEEVQVHISSASTSSKALTMWLLQLFFFLQVTYRISDNAVTFCLKFFKAFFSVLGQFCKVAAEIAGLLPSSLYRAKPGPHEPKHDINSFLAPLVSELKQFWSGVELNVFLMEMKKIRCALLCVACDLPAGRKVCGFLSHNAHFGCSRCWKKFRGSVGSMDFSGFDREHWRTRTGSEHRMLATRQICMTTKSYRDDAESSSSCRYSVLLELPYFDAPHMLIVDPMHNFLVVQNTL